MEGNKDREEKRRDEKREGVEGRRGQGKWDH